MICEEDVECEEGDILCGQHNEEACAFLDDEEIVEVTEQGFRDERVKAIGLQAPGALGMIDPSTVETPALLMSADQDGWLPHAREAAPIWDALHQPEDLWLRFADAGHLSFITMCDEEAFTPSIIEQFLPGVANDGCNADYMSSMDMSDINTAYLVMFAEKHVFGTSHWDAYLYGDLSLELTDGVNMTRTGH